MLRKLLVLYINFILFTTPSVGQRSSSNRTCGYLRSQYTNAAVQNQSGGCCGKASDVLVAPDVDITGYGYCHTHSINMTAGWRWTQYPSPLKITQTPVVDPGFIGKNAIVWYPDGVQMFGFVIGNITDKTTIEVMGIKDDNNQDVSALQTGMCLFTLDKTNYGADNEESEGVNIEVDEEIAGLNGEIDEDIEVLNEGDGV